MERDYEKDNGLIRKLIEKDFYSFHKIKKKRSTDSLILISMRVHKEGLCDTCGEKLLKKDMLPKLYKSKGGRQLKRVSWYCCELHYPFRKEFTKEMWKDLRKIVSENWDILEERRLS